MMKGVITVLNNLYNIKMEELANKLNSIPDAYIGFVAGIITYVKKKPERLKAVSDFIDSNDSLLSSDIVEFVMNQPDFYEDGIGL